MAELTVYPDAHAETTSVDGNVYIDGVNETWATIRARSAGGTAVTTATNPTCAHIQASATTNQWATLARGFFLFDTSAIAANQVVTAATFSLYGQANVNQFAGLTLCLVASTPASNTDLVVGDFDQVGAVEFSTTRPTLPLATDAYTDFTLNAAGRAAIAKGGITKFAVRISSDFDDSPPTWASGQETYASVYNADNGSNKPKLVVTYQNGTKALFFAQY